MTLMTINIALAVLNGLLALTIAVVYLRNHRQLRSPFTLALSLFALFLVVHNGVRAYHLATMMATYTAQAEVLLLVEGILQVVALGALAYATLR